MNVDDVAEFAAFSYNVNTKELVQKSYDAQLVMLDTQVLKGIVIDPRIANWFKSSSPIQAQVSEPYFMPIIGRSGITIHRKSINGTAFGADILLEEVSEVLRDSDENRDALRVMYDDDFNVYGYSQPELFKVRDALRLRTILKLSDINHPLIASTASVVEFGPVAKEINYEGEKWVVKIDRVRGTRDQMFNLVMAVKSEHLLKESNLVARRSIIGSLIALLAVLPCIYFASQWLARPIRQATKKAKSIEHFKFNAVSQNRSRVTEIKEMSDSLRSMHLR
ncbi:chemotactic transducer-related protein [Vibrio variabilis]|uniref:Chemotactic transducer-related protein n=1 Tax=Vibrio variabilis TaxID=990271 RepID=A0ABQ0J925_9VIBR|nr:chemotactic transducer-related protein [Vibrio variabilis]